MTASTQENPNQEIRQDTTEINLTKQRQFYERKLAEERSAREQMEKQLQELSQKIQPVDDDDDPEPYVDHKKLAKKLAKFEETTKQQTQKELQQTKESVKEEIRNELWLEQHPDFENTLTQHVNTLFEKAPALAQALLAMPDGFARQKLVYQNIKQLGLDQPPKKEPSIQEQIDAKKGGFHYQPSGIGTAPYNSAPGDFSAQGQKNAYEYIQQLKSRLTL